jgi:hypothetical protein
MVRGTRSNGNPTDPHQPKGQEVMARKTNSELLEEIEQLKDDIGYWNNIAHEFERYGMQRDAELAEAKDELSNAESSIWDLKYMIEHAETLEDLEDMKLRSMHL